MQRFGIVVSDMHLGTGHRKGHQNHSDDFREDERFAQLLKHHCSGEFAEAEGTLVMNGDIFDFLKVRLLTKAVDAIDARHSCLKLRKCLNGHPIFVEALRAWIAHPKRSIVFQPGNHDMDFFFPEVQRQFCRALTGTTEDPRVRCISDVASFIIDGVAFHHGHQFDAIHAFDFGKLFVRGINGHPILNLPWGSLFMIHVLNELTDERPWLDKVHPFWPMFVGGMLLDTRFTGRMVGRSVVALARARVNPNWWQKRPFTKLTQFLRNDIAFFENLDHHAEKMLKHTTGLSAVIMGNTHVPKVRSFRGGGVYVNTGTWIPMVDLTLGKLGQRLELHYAFIDWSEAKPDVSLRRWNGTQAISEEVVA